MKWLESSTFSKFKLSSTFNCLSDPVYTGGHVVVNVCEELDVSNQAMTSSMN